MKLDELNPELFTYELYEPNFGCIIDSDNYKFSLDPEIEFLRSIKKYALGYCDASRLTIRPRTDMVAIMCEIDGVKLWFHIRKDTLKKLVGSS